MREWTMTLRLQLLEILDRKFPMAPVCPLDRQLCEVNLVCGICAKIRGGKP